MWKYLKKLQYPVKIKTPNPASAKLILAQLGGPDGEMGAATRYLNQRYAMPYDEGKATLTDIGTEESAHLMYKLQQQKDRYCIFALPILLLQRTNGCYLRKINTFHALICGRCSAYPVHLL